jgi:hypothetical protein
MDTAKPALSSAGEVIFEPEDSSSKDVLKLELDCSRYWAVRSADMFVLITITHSVSRPRRALILRDVHAAGEPVKGRSTVSLSLSALPGG